MLISNFVSPIRRGNWSPGSRPRREHLTGLLSTPRRIPTRVWLCVTLWRRSAFRLLKFTFRTSIPARNFGTNRCLQPCVVGRFPASAHFHIFWGWKPQLTLKLNSYCLKYCLFSEKSSLLGFRCPVTPLLLDAHLDDL